jgi:RNA polymerase sigma factor (sigma-70 family)
MGVMGDSPPLTGNPAPALTDLELRHQAWYEAYGPAIYRYVRFHLPTADAAEDVTADVFLKAFRAAERYDAAKGAPEAWLFRIAKNTVKDWLRRTKVRRHVSIGQMRDLASDTPSPEERLLWEEQVALLLAAVAELPEGDREVISLRYGSGLDSARMAEILGIRESAVRTRLWRALTRLRTLLEAEP